MQTLAEALSKMHAQSPERRLVPDWKTYLPAGSRWWPGDLGEPGCPQCRGVGYVRLDVPIGHEFFGKLLACDCAQAKIAADRSTRLQQASALVGDDLALVWSDIILTPAIGQAIRAVRETLERGFGWVYLYGPPGPGKTVVLKAAVAELVRGGQEAVFANWSDMLQHMRSGYDAGDFDSRVEAWRAVGVLAIDEYGRAKETEWAQEIRARVMNHRYEAAIGQRSITLFASNFAPEEGEDWLADRVRDGRFEVVEVSGPSMRPLMG